MSDTAKPMPGGATGLEQTVKFLEPWVIATLPISHRDGQVVDVEHATDAEFQEWIVNNSIPVEDHGIVAWSFDDRCGVINHAISQALPLKFGE